MEPVEESELAGTEDQDPEQVIEPLDLVDPLEESELAGRIGELEKILADNVGADDQGLVEIAEQILTDPREEPELIRS